MVLDKFQRDLSQLRATIHSTTSLITTFQSSLISPGAPVSSISNPRHPLRLLHDASSLLKAQTTKLSLLILNKPFTPSAITTIIKSISTQCLPALMSALELCQPKQYTSFLRELLKGQVARILREMRLLLESIPTEDADAGEKEGRSTLANAGVLWEVCDALVSLANDGMVQLAAQKAESYHALLKDAIAELEKWDPDEEDDDDVFEDSVSSESDAEQSEEAASPPTATLNAMTLTPPATPTPIRRLQTETLSTLRLIRLLYPALTKRRIRTFPPMSSSITPPTLPSNAQVAAFDALLNRLQDFSEAADALAGSLYGHDEDGVERDLEALKCMAISCVEEARQNWSGTEDEFSTWGEKWKERMEAFTGPTRAT